MQRLAPLGILGQLTDPTVFVSANDRTLAGTRPPRDIQVFAAAVARGAVARFQRRIREPCLGRLERSAAARDRPPRLTVLAAVRAVWTGRAGSRQVPAKCK